MHTPVSGHRPNWMLRSFILVSAGVHLVLVLHLTGIYQSRAVTYIELSMKERAKPNTRKIPRPRIRPKPRQTKVNTLPAPAPKTAQVYQKVLKPETVPVPDIKVPKITPPSLPGRISTAGISVPGLAMPSSVPAGVPAGEAITFTSAKDYFEMLNLRIHSAKTYPKDAREQHIEGRVKVEFALKQDGNLSSIRVVTPSRHRGLDQAAIEAVKKAAPFPRPPAALFTPPLTLRITILFELV